MNQPDDIKRALDKAYSSLKKNNKGHIASYIPELSKANHKHFAIAITDVEGNSYTIGDSNVAFSIQSISKVVTYVLALENKGRTHVRKKVGVEPTGEAFNSIVKLDAHNKPFNPMTNAGAITTTDMVKGVAPNTKFNHILKWYEKSLGSTPKIDNQVYTSENKTGHLNRSIAHLLTHFDILCGNTDEALQLYFKQCSILTSAEELSVLGATLANRGVSPVTNKTVIQRKDLRDILSVMFTCGLYDGAGRWAYEVGIPAKSGVSGGILAVVPGQYGIGIYSPLIDNRGNSIRGTQACKLLSKQLGWHVFGASKYL